MPHEGSSTDYWSCLLCLCEHTEAALCWVGWALFAMEYMIGNEGKRRDGEKEEPRPATWVLGWIPAPGKYWEQLYCDVCRQWRCSAAPAEDPSSSVVPCEEGRFLDSKGRRTLQGHPSSLWFHNLYRQIWCRQVRTSKLSPKPEQLRLDPVNSLLPWCPLQVSAPPTCHGAKQMPVGGKR